MSFLVFLHVIPLDAAVGAVSAALGLLSSVSVPVLLEGLGPTKPLVADVALERFLACVGPLMSSLFLFSQDLFLTSLIMQNETFQLFPVLGGATSAALGNILSACLFSCFFISFRWMQR